MEWPLDTDRLPWKFKVAVIEVDRSFDYHRHDLHPEYMHTRYRATVDSIESVQLELARFGLTLNALVYPDRCDYPL